LNSGDESLLSVVLKSAMCRPPSIGMTTEP